MSKVIPIRDPAESNFFLDDLPVPELIELEGLSHSDLKFFN